MKAQFLLISIIFYGNFLFAQNAEITGTITDNNNDLLIGANLFLVNTEKGTISDFDANYKIENIPAGTYTLQCSFISYKTQSKEITLCKGQTLNIDFTLSADINQLDEVKIEAKKNRESENLLLMERKNASNIQESIGANELSRKGANNAAGGVQKVAGISMLDNHKLFVRGLGDRYNKTQLNGIPIASPDPDERLIPLDLFPTGILSTIEISKVYDATKFADYSGALIDLHTKEFPEKKFYIVKASTGVNTSTTFKDFRLGGSSQNWFSGFSLKERENYQPEELKIKNRNEYFTNEDPFGSDFSSKQITAIPNIALGISGGNSLKLKNGASMGFIFSTGYGNDFKSVSGQDVVLRADGIPLRSFSFNNYTYATKFSNLGSVSFNSGNNSITYNIVYLNNTNNQLSNKNGFDGEGYNLYVRTSTFHDHRLFANQLIGNHKFGKALNLNWKASYSTGKSAEPDRQGVVFEQCGDNYSLFSLNQGETLRYFSNMRDSTYAATADLSYLIGNTSNGRSKGKLSFGIHSMGKFRDFNSYMYFYNIDEISDIEANLGDNNNTADIDITQLINDDVFADSLVSIKNNSQERDAYQAQLIVHAAYVDFTYNITPLFTLNAGLRAELSNQSVRFFTNIWEENGIAALNLYPALNLKYSINENSNLRLSASKTLTRADFLEMAPFRYRPSYGSATSFGNDSIKNANNYNLDLKYELFNAPGEIFSIGLYGKILNTPIERISLNQGGGLEYSFRNAKGGKVFGIEMEFKKKIYDRIFVGCNASYIYTHINLYENSSNTFKSHAMQGASPYLINADIMYRLLDADKVKTDISMVYNVYGPRIYAVGDGGKGDIYELPFHQLDIITQTIINGRLGISMEFKNLLNSNRAFVQDVVKTTSDGYIKDGVKEITSYKMGLWVAMGIHYKF
jgi:hypothetical protein